MNSSKVKYPLLNAFLIILAALPQMIFAASYKHPNSNTWVHVFEATSNLEARTICDQTATSLGYPNNSCYSPLWTGYYSYPANVPNDQIEYSFAIVVNNHPKEAAEECGYANPILPSSGTKVQTEIDYRGTGALPLEVRRTFSSRKAYNSLGSRQWRWNYGNRYLLDVNQGSGRVKLEYPNGRGIFYTEQSDGSWTADRDTPMVVSKIATTQGHLWEVSGGEADRVERFDEGGRILKVTQRGAQLNYVHSVQATGTTLTVTHHFGHQMIINIDVNDKPTEVLTPAGENITYEYNTDGSIKKVIYPDATPNSAADNPSRIYHYESTVSPIAVSKYLLTGITDERGIRYVTWEYSNGLGDANPRAMSSEHAGVDKFEISSMEPDGSVTVTNPLGKQSMLYFSDINGIKKHTSTEGLASPHCGASTQSKTYDSAGYLESNTDWEGNLTFYTRDSRGLALTTTDAVGTLDERVVTTQWHSEFRLPEVITEPGRTTTYTYSPSTNPNYTQKTVTDTATGAVRIWNYTYSALGQILTIDGPRGDVTDTATYTYYDCTTGGPCGQIHTLTNGLNQVTTYNSYDAHGYPTQVTDANGTVTTLAYDQRQRPTTITVDSQTTMMTYEPNGNVQRVTLADGTYTEYVRDNANRLVTLFDGQGNRIDWTLDDAGNRTDEQIKDPNGQIRKSLQTQYDELSRVRGMIYAHGGSSAYTYDSNGNQIQHTDASNRVSSTEYDALDRVIKDIDAIAGETAYTYDDRDNLTTVTDPEGLTTTYTYNGFDEVVSEQSPDTGTTSYTYDSAGNRATQTDARGITATYTYDALNRLTQISYPDSSENITYAYDQGTNGVGRLTQITDASGTTDYGYDARGNTTSVTQTVGGQSYTQTYTYNGANRLTGMTYPSGRAVTYTHDTSGRINQITSVGNEGSETLANTIARLPFGPVSSLTLGNGIQRTRTYDQDYRVESLTDGSVFAKGLAYSAVNNITAITDNVDTNLSQLFTYDDLDRLDFATGNYGDDTYGYDGIGNRLLFTRDTQSESYQYGSVSHRLQSVAGQSYQYDAAGNTLSGGAKSYTYNDRNRLVSATANGATTDYQHNALGQRVVKGSGSDQIHYVYDLEGRLIAEAQSGSVTVEYAYLDGEPLVMWRESDTPPPTTPPIKSVLTSPINYFDVDTASPTFVWERDPLASEYRFRVYDRTDKAWIYDETFDGSSLCTANSCSITPPITLSHNNNHLWRVRGENEIGVGTWSDYGRFDYPMAAPGQVTLVSPLGNVTSASLDYSWQPDAASTEYRVRIYDRTDQLWVYDETHDSSAACTASNCSVTPAVTIDFAHKYLWRAQGQNATGVGAWSASGYFLPAKVGKPVTISPTGDIPTDSPEYRWERQPLATEYRLRLYDRASATWVFDTTYSVDAICDTDCGVTANFTLGSAAQGYFWRVVGKNGAGQGTWSDYIRVTYVPPAPSLIQNGGFESGLTDWLSCSSSGSTQTISDPSEGSSALEITGSDCLYQEFTVSPGESYTLQCDAKGQLTQYTSVTLSIMDQNYSDLVTQEVEITSTGYQAYTATAASPTGGTIGAVTFYSEDAGVFDACSVVQE